MEDNQIETMLTKAENAILVIDMENDFVLPGAPLQVSGALATLPAIKRFLDFGRANGWAIIYILRIHRPSGVDAELFRRHFFEEGKPFCIAGTRKRGIPCLPSSEIMK